MQNFLALLPTVLWRVLALIATTHPMSWLWRKYTLCKSEWHWTNQCLLPLIYTHVQSMYITTVKLIATLHLPGQKLCVRCMLQQHCCSALTVHKRVKNSSAKQTIRPYIYMYIYILHTVLLAKWVCLVGYLANWHDFEMIMIRAFRNSADNFNVEN